jgi:hypothetical protein
MEEIKLVYSTLVLSNFTTGVDSPFLGAVDLRGTANAIFYIKTLTAHAGELTTHVHGREQPNYFHHLKRIFQQKEQCIREQNGGGSFTTLDEPCPTECGDLSFLKVLEIMPISPFAVEDPAAALCGLETPPFDDIWNGLLDDWAASLDPQMISLNNSFL